MGWKYGFDAMPEPLVLVRCRRCHKPASLWSADASGEGEWQNPLYRRCRCDPPPELPKGEELDALVAKARLSRRYDGRAGVSVSR